MFSTQFLNYSEDEVRAVLTVKCSGKAVMYDMNFGTGELKVGDESKFYGDDSIEAQQYKRFILDLVQAYVGVITNEETEKDFAGIMNAKCMLILALYVSRLYEMGLNFLENNVYELAIKYYNIFSISVSDADVVHQELCLYQDPEVTAYAMTRSNCAEIMKAFCNCLQEYKDQLLKNIRNKKELSSFVKMYGDKRDSENKIDVAKFD